jgi:hypothetical protein
LREIASFSGNRLSSCQPLLSPNDEPIFLLEVINSTREPDGSFKHYWLRVPPTMKTARDAAAWTFDIPADEYAPAIET